MSSLSGDKEKNQMLPEREQLVAVASFSNKIGGGGGLIFLQNWRRRPHSETLLAAVLTWSGYWILLT